MKESPAAHSKRERVLRACMRCRVRKIKCTGTVPCDGCLRENIACRKERRRIKMKIQKKLPESQTLYIAHLEEQFDRSRAVIDSLFHIVEQMPEWSNSGVRDRADGELCLNTLCERLGIGTRSASSTPCCEDEDQIATLAGSDSGAECSEDKAWLKEDLHLRPPPCIPSSPTLDRSESPEPSSRYTEMLVLHDDVGDLHFQATSSIQTIPPHQLTDPDVGPTNFDQWPTGWEDHTISQNMWQGCWQPAVNDVQGWDFVGV